VDIFKETNFCVILVVGVRIQSLMSRTFEERQYRRAYLKQMHELLKDCSSCRSRSYSCVSTTMEDSRIVEEVDE